MIDPTKDTEVTATAREGTISRVTDTSSLRITTAGLCTESGLRWGEARETTYQDFECLLLLFEINIIYYTKYSRYSKSTDNRTGQ